MDGTAEGQAQHGELPIQQLPLKPGAKRIRRPMPACPVHHVQMFVGSSTAVIQYCYCPIEGCIQSAKRTRDVEPSAN